MKETHLLSKVRAILHERGYRNPCRPLESLTQRIEETERNVARKVFIYKWPGLILLALIPILSTLLSVLVTEPHPAHGFMYGISYSLTFLTVFNSIFRPSERFKEACRMGVDFELIKTDFLAQLESLPKGDNESHLHGMIQRFSKLVAPYQKELISMFLPEVAVEPGKNGAHGGKTQADSKASARNIRPSAKTKRSA
jgi:hypothetical protein